MKCDNCRASWETNTENGYEGGCHLEGLIDKQYSYTDEGCTIHHKTVKKLMGEHEQHKDDFYESFGEWVKERMEIKETCVICGETYNGMDTTTCDSNHNTVSEPCGQTICYKCWERERSESIHNGTVPKCCQKRRQANDI